MATVAALVVTNRPHFLPWVTHQIAKQTRQVDEVVIVTNAVDLDAYDYDDIKRRLGIDNVVLCKVPQTQKITLGELRQWGHDLSNSDIFLWFDDDDWYHPQRVELSVPPIESGRYDASIFPITHTYYVEEGLLFLREGGIGIYLPASTWRASLAKKAIFAPVALGEDGRWLNRVVHPDDGNEPLIKPYRIYCVPDYLKPAIGCIILVHSRNVWQYPFEEKFRAMGVIPWPKWTPAGVTKEEWDYTKQMLDELSRTSAAQGPRPWRPEPWGIYDQVILSMFTVR